MVGITTGDRRQDCARGVCGIGAISRVHTRISRRPSVAATGDHVFHIVKAWARAYDVCVVACFGFHTQRAAGIEIVIPTCFFFGWRAVDLVIFARKSAEVFRDRSGQRRITAGQRDPMYRC